MPALCSMVNEEIVEPPLTYGKIIKTDRNPGSESRK